MSDDPVNLLTLELGANPDVGMRTGRAWQRVRRELEQLRIERDAVLALAAEWEKEASADYPRNLTAEEIHEFNGERSTCRWHAAELREALGDQP